MMPRADRTAAGSVWLSGSMDCRSNRGPGVSPVRPRFERHFTYCSGAYRCCKRQKTATGCASLVLRRQRPLVRIQSGAPVLCGLFERKRLFHAGNPRLRLFYTKLTHFLLCQTRHWTASRKRQKRVSRSFCPERTSVQHSPVGSATMRWMCVASTE